MLVSRGQTHLKLVPIVGSCRLIYSTAVLALDKKWRKNLGLTQNPNAFGPLTNLPDYTYVDGRLTPIGMNMMRRLERQKSAAQEMVEKIREVDFAKRRYAKMQQSEQERRQQLISSKLKPKGALLLKSDTGFTST